MQNKSVYFLMPCLLFGVSISSGLFSAESFAEGVVSFEKSTVLANNTFIYNPKTLRWTAVDEHERVVRSGRGSGGRGYCPDIHRSCRTPTGTYHIISKGDARCHSSRYPVGRGGAPMPYCMFFSKYYAVHGSPDVPAYNASHGCVRVRPSDARWLNHNFMHVGTKVVIKPY